MMIDHLKLTLDEYFADSRNPFDCIVRNNIYTHKFTCMK